MYLYKSCQIVPTLDAFEQSWLISWRKKLPKKKNYNNNYEKLRERRAQTAGQSNSVGKVVNITSSYCSISKSYDTWP